jgi:hypothetical protein
MLPVSVGALPRFRCRALYVMELPKLKDCGDDIERAANRTSRQNQDAGSPEACEGLPF